MLQSETHVSRETVATASSTDDAIPMRTAERPEQMNRRTQLTERSRTILRRAAVKRAGHTTPRARIPIESNRRDTSVASSACVRRWPSPLKIPTCPSSTPPRTGRRLTVAIMRSPAGVLSRAQSSANCGAPQRLGRNIRATAVTSTFHVKHRRPLARALRCYSPERGRTSELVLAELAWTRGELLHRAPQRVRLTSGTS